MQAVRHGWLITIEDGFSLSDEAVREFAGFLKSIAVRSPNEYKEENAAHLDGHPGEPLHPRRLHLIATQQRPPA